MGTGPGPVKVWPLWGRVVFWVVLGLLLVGALLEAIRGGSMSWAAARVAVVVVAVPSLATLLVGSVRRGRTKRSPRR